MRNKLDVYEKAMQGRVVAILRQIDTTKAVPIAKALVAGGITAMEITMDTPGALAAISDVRSELGATAVVGVGTVLDGETARTAILAGAQFIVAPNLDENVIAMGHRYNIPVMPGCMTPTEIQRAYALGCDIVKIFPAHTVGPSFFKSVKAPLSHVTLMATGGVSAANAGEYRQAGADLLGIGGSLMQTEWVVNNDFAKITEAARALLLAAQ